MSVGLAIAKIGEYTALYDMACECVNRLQGQLLAMGTAAAAQGGGVVNPASENVRRQLAIATYLQGLYKEFLDYWKQVVKDFFAMIKSLQELAQGAR